jgi:hypothetical protein
VFRYVKGGTPNQITVSATDEAFSIRWQVTTYDDHESATGNDLDFTVSNHARDGNRAAHGPLEG